MNASDPDTVLAQRRQDLEEVLVRLPLTDFQKIAIRAAASALAKAKAVAVISTFVDQADAANERPH